MNPPKCEQLCTVIVAMVRKADISKMRTIDYARAFIRQLLLGTVMFDHLIVY